MLDDLQVSPTPYHAVARARELLASSGFTEIDLAAPFPGDAGSYMVADGGALVAWVQAVAPSASFGIVGAHTDSPNLRIRANAQTTSGGFAQLGVEIYGGVLLNSWLDRDLGLAGRITTSTGDEVLMMDDRPILRIPQLAIHLHREIREKGLNLDPQRHLVPLWAVGEDDPDAFRNYLAEQSGVAVDDIMSWDVMTFDVQPPAVVGRDADMLASARIDNLVSTFCGTRALMAAADSGAIDAGAQVPVLVLYDHEEIGSESSTGASGSFLSAILERMTGAVGGTRIDYLQALASSFVVSADGAHATHPNYVDKHEPNHLIEVNGGVTVKRNANQRYATDARTEARFRSLCAAAGVDVQTYIHRNDLPCGSTIGPITSGQLAAQTVDVGVPQLAMHSAREMCGLGDIADMTTVLTAFFGGQAAGSSPA